MRKSILYLLCVLIAISRLAASLDEPESQPNRTPSTLNSIVTEEDNEAIEVHHTESDQEVVVDMGSSDSQEVVVNMVSSDSQEDLDHERETLEERQQGHISREVYEYALRKLNKNQKDSITYAACTERLWYGVENVFEIAGFGCLLSVAIFAKLGYTDLAFYFSIAGMGSKMVEHFAEKRRKNKREVYTEIIRQYELEQERRQSDIV